MFFLFICVVVLAVLQSRLFNALDELRQRVRFLEGAAPAAPRAAPYVQKQAAPKPAPAPFVSIPRPVAVREPEKPPSKSHVPSPSFDLKIDWEMFTGVKLFSWIGGLALFLGAVFFVKYSMDHGWISPLVRVAAGLVFGAGAIGGGLLMRRHGYEVTVQTLCAAGVGILYADAFGAHSLYGFINGGASFLFMTLVTVLAFALAVRLDSRYIALLGLAGGFLTPPLLSTGVDRALGLFSYIALLDLGLAAVALRKRWNFLLSLAAAGTVVMQWGWSASYFKEAKVFTGMAVFLIFPLLFAAAHLKAAAQKIADKWTRVPAGILPLLSLAFAAHMLGFPGLGAKPWLALTFILLAGLLASALALRDDELRPCHWAAGAAAFLLLSLWTTKYMQDSLLPWGLFFYLAFAGLHAAFPIALQKRRPSAPPFLLGHLYPVLMLVPVMIVMAKSLISPFLVWPAVLLLDLMVLAGAAAAGLAWLGALAVIMTMAAAGLWLVRLPAGAGIEGLLFTVLMFAGLFFAAGLYLSRRRERAARADAGSAVTGSGISGAGFSQLPALSALLPFLLLIMAVGRLDLPNPAPVFGLGALLALMLLGLAYFQVSGAVVPVALGSAALLQYAWHFRAFAPEMFSWIIPWYTGYMGLFLVFPVLCHKRVRDSFPVWAASAMAGPVYFYLIYRAVTGTIGGDYIGFLPALFAGLYLAAVREVLRILPAGHGQRQKVLALFMGVALFFISLIFPLQFDKEWITLGWALEGVALAALYRRIPHPGLKAWAGGLLALVFVRLALNPAVFSYHARASFPILNWYLYTYGIAALCFWAAARLWRPKDEKLMGTPVVPVFAALGTILTFLLLNIEIADFFSTGQTLTFEFTGSLAKDMAYTLGWAAFGLTLLVAGIMKSSKGARFGGMGLLSVTALKLFLHDLWLLGQLYRVGAFVGLAGVLILASFLYQRYVTKPRAV